MSEIGPEFFERDVVTCARELVGCVFRWKGCESRIVETEAYAAVGDQACHTWSRPSARDFVARHSAGTAYVYMNYGIHWLFNVLVKGAEGEGFVLFRALEPVSGIDKMLERTGPRPLATICAGPGKLTRACGITGADHGLHFLERRETGIRVGDKTTVAVDVRVGISKDAHFLWRFGDPASPAVSRKFPATGR